MRHRNSVILSTGLVVVLVLLMPIDVQVFAIEADSPLPPTDTLLLNIMVIKNLQLDNFTWTLENNTISVGQATLSMQVRNLTTTYRVEFEVSAKNVSVLYSYGSVPRFPYGRFHFDTLILKGYADLNERTVTVQAFKPMRVVDLLWGL